MTFQPILTSEFKEHFAFAAFCDVSDQHAEQALERGLDYVSQDWVCESDYQMGQMLSAAHLLTLAGLGTGAEASLAQEGLLGFTSIKSGGLTVSRQASGAGSKSRQGAGGGSSGSGGEDLYLTTYGQRYLALLRRNRAGPRVATP